MAKLTVQQICKKYDLSKVYVMRALSKQWLTGGEKVLMPGTRVEQWMIDEQHVIEWRKRTEAHKSSASGFTGSAKDLRELQEFAQSLKSEDLQALIKSLQAK